MKFPTYLILLCLTLPSLIAQTNCNYQGDVDNDGAVTVNDVITVLSEFGAVCIEPVDSSNFQSCGDDFYYYGRNYPTRGIGSQCWFEEDLRSGYYSNGDEIPLIMYDDSVNYWGLDAVWASTDYGARTAQFVFCTDLINYDYDWPYLYNGYAVLDPRGVCPNGFHVPTDQDWRDLEEFLGMSISELYDWGGARN